MTRSCRHTPILQITCCRSEKDDKRIWHKKLRARERVLLTNGQYDDLHQWDFREVSDVWLMGKDGKLWYGDDMKPEWARK